MKLHTQGQRGVGDGAYAAVLQNFEILFNWDSHRRTHQQCWQQPATPRHLISQINKAPMDIKYKRVTGNASYVLRIKLDETIDDGDGDATTIQGLNAAAAPKSSPPSQACRHHNANRNPSRHHTNRQR